MDLKKMLIDQQDAHLNATWGGSIHALEELRRHIDIQINKLPVFIVFILLMAVTYIIYIKILNQF